MKSLITLCSVLGLSAAAHATVVFQDTFADGDLATNPGIGGGLDQSLVGGGFVEASGSITGDSSVNNNRAYAFTTNTFDLSAGFTLNFVANTTNLGNNSANRFSVGLAAAGADFAAGATSGANFLGVSGSSGAFGGFGVDFTVDQGQGLSFNDGAGTITELDNSQTIAADTDLNVTITVDADGDYTYSINGATAATGASGLDLTQEYHFATYFQDNLADHSISEVTLSVVPEPSSAALLGLGGLALILRRRK